MISLGPGKMNIDIFNKFVMGHAILTKVIGLVNKTLNMTFFNNKKRSSRFMLGFGLMTS